MRATVLLRFHHVTLPWGDGTTAMDHVLIARSGIVVLETTHDAGIRLADPTAPRWTQQCGPATSQFHNPLRQNYKHWQAITRLLYRIPRTHIHPLVVLTGRARFHLGPPPGIVDVAGLVQHIQGYRTSVLSEQHMAWCMGRLECQRYRLSRQTDVEHHASLTRTFGDVPGHDHPGQRARGREHEPLLAQVRGKDPAPWASAMTGAWSPRRRGGRARGGCGARSRGARVVRAQAAHRRGGGARWPYHQPNQDPQR